MAKTTKINLFARAVTARHDLNTCERMLNTAHLYANKEIKPLIEQALRIISDQRLDLSDALAEARTQAQKVRTFFIKDVPVEVPEGYDVKRVTMTGELRLNVYRSESRELIGQIYTANRELDRHRKLLAILEMEGALIAYEQKITAISEAYPGISRQSAKHLLKIWEK